MRLMEFLLMAGFGPPERLDRCVDAHPGCCHCIGMIAETILPHFVRAAGVPARA